MNRETRYKEIMVVALKMQFEVEAFTPYIEAEDGREGFSVFRSFPTEVLDGDGECVGCVSGGTGYVVISYHGEEWLISHRDLWLAFEKAWKEARDDQRRLLDEKG